MSEINSVFVRTRPNALVILPMLLGFSVFTVLTGLSFARHRIWIGTLFIALSSIFLISFILVRISYAIRRRERMHDVVGAQNRRYQDRGIRWKYNETEILVEVLHGMVTSYQTPMGYAPYYPSALYGSVNQPLISTTKYV
eukprot:Phypoly_transcript_12816.p1 GENE.Phypoly_transcript_12816~~Phypoly_transcript_12816.p1  ORF type:complete len:140 (+),score=1.56 Phypoly_transcript_12816:570-989(+)